MIPLQKRVRFLETVCGAALEGVRCVHGRARSLGKAPPAGKTLIWLHPLRCGEPEGSVRVLSAPFIKTGGVFVAPQGRGCGGGAGGGPAYDGTLGGAVEQVAEAVLPESGIVRKLVVIRKEKPTPGSVPPGVPIRSKRERGYQKKEL